MNADTPELARSRKDDHIELALELMAGAAPGPDEFDGFSVRHRALPEMALEQVDLSSYFLGKKVQAPIVIESMCGGSERGGRINRNLAVAARECGAALFLGSGKAGLMDPGLMDTYKVRRLCPDAPLYANLGAGNLGTDFLISDCERLVRELDADGLVFHLNPLQEALQAEGETDFRGKLDLIAQAAATLDFPVVVKEVGHGLDPELVMRLSRSGVSAVDIAGAGGVSFAAIEGRRAQDPATRKAAQALRGFGLSTVSILTQLWELPVTVPIIASGGIRNGLDAFKALCLRATWVGVAGALLAAADRSEQDAVTELQAIIKTLRIAMFCTGCKTLDDPTPRLLHPEPKPGF